MKILISPAKSLNLDKVSHKIESSNIVFRDEAWSISKVLKDKSPKELSELMNISDKLAQLNWIRNQNYKENFEKEEPKQSLFMFDGEVFNGIESDTLDIKSLMFLQDNLRILSGQYGLLKPLDLIMPYRLEMGTKLSVEGSINLYDFWGSKITDKINSDIEEGEFVLNLASNEYFKSVKVKELNAKVITPIFKDYKNGKLKTISFFAKKARGLMVRFIAENKIEDDIDKLKSFNYEGYSYSDDLSDEKNFVFIR